MAGQDLSLNINTKSDVPQAMEKAKSATVSFAKQIEDVQKKFSTGFKDIFLGFTAPMVLLQGAIQLISSAIAQAKQDAKEGLDLVAKGETIYATSDEKKMANFFKAKAAREAEQKAVKDGLTEMTRLYLDSEEGKKVYMQFLKEMGPIKFNEEDAKKQDFTISNPRLQQLALEAFLASPEGQAYKPVFDEAKNAEKAGSFKGPEGFSSVVGVGANPVMEKMTKQNELLEEIKEILWEQTRINSGGQVPNPFTERVPITLMKIGSV
jgi:hypothetical protein